MRFENVFLEDLVGCRSISLTRDLSASACTLRGMGHQIVSAAKIREMSHEREKLSRSLDEVCPMRRGGVGRMRRRSRRTLLPSCLTGLGEWVQYCDGVLGCCWQVRLVAPWASFTGNRSHSSDNRGQ